MWLVIIILIVVALYVDYLIAREFSNAAEDKGYPEQKYLWICFFLGPIGYLLVIALPCRTLVLETSGSDPINSNSEWKCACGRTNPDYVRTCVCGKSKHDAE